MNSRFWALVLAGVIAVSLIGVLLVLRANASAPAPLEYSGARADVGGLTYQQAKLHATAMHDELCEVWSQDSQRITNLIHERYGADPADIVFVAGLLCPINR